MLKFLYVFQLLQEDLFIGSCNSFFKYLFSHRPVPGFRFACVLGRNLNIHEISKDLKRKIFFTNPGKIFKNIEIVEFTVTP